MAFLYASQKIGEGQYEKEMLHEKLRDRKKKKVENNKTKNETFHTYNVPIKIVLLYLKTFIIEGAVNILYNAVCSFLSNKGGYRRGQQTRHTLV